MMHSFLATSSWRGCFFLFFSLLLPRVLWAQSPPELLLLSPANDSVVVSKMPHISFRCSVPLIEDTLLILFDGTDITALVHQERGVYSYLPQRPVGAGEHSLYVIGVTEGGVSVEKELVFASRHSESFAEIYLNNSVSATVTSVLARDVSATGNTALLPVDPAPTTSDTPYTSLETYLRSEGGLREGKWQSSARAALRYYDQNASVVAPEQKGLGLLDVLIRTSYTTKNTALRAELGDTVVEETKNTLDYLARRGVKASLSVKNITINTFGLLAAEPDYTPDDFGLDLNGNDHIMGGSVNVDFFAGQLFIKGIYARGGERGAALGTWTETDGHKGDVAGLLVKTDFFDNKLTSEFELNTVNYDNDTSDTMGEGYDKAYRLTLGGSMAHYSYEVGYTYTGPGYQVVGNQSLVKDWAGYAFVGSMNSAAHSLRLLLNYSWDNVDDDELFARLYSFSGAVEYLYSGWQYFPVSLLVEHNRQRSRDEPVGCDPVSLQTNALTAAISYVQGPWAVELKTGYSRQDDEAGGAYGTELVSFSLVPSYSSTSFSLLPSWTYSSSRDLSTDVTTETNTVTLDVYATFFAERLVCQFGGTYDEVTSDDKTMGLTTSSLYGKISYRFDRLWFLEESSIGLEYASEDQEDNVNEAELSEQRVSLVLSTTLPFML